MKPEAPAGNPYTAGIADFVARLDFDAIPGHVRERAKLLMLDALGSALYAAPLPWCRIVRDALAAVDSTGRCAVWGTGLKLSAPHAALANGTQVQGFELDDVHRAGVLHVGAVVLPALVAVAETRPGLAGKDFLAAAVAGYEVGPRVGICMGTQHIAQGWHSGATVGVFAAAAAAARGLKLDADRTVHALGIAGTQAAGLMAAQYGAMVKRVHAGRSSQSGLYGALLAEAGLTGIVNVFESDYGGFCTTFSRSTDRFNMDELTRGLGETWQTMGVALKFYSSVMSTHTTLDALRGLLAQEPFGPDDVERITVHAHEVTVEHSGWKYQPAGVTAAQLNLPFCVATLLTEGEVFVDQFNEDAIADPRRMALAERVTVLHDPEITAAPRRLRHTVRVEVKLKNGKVLEASEVFARGSDEKFASESEVIAKFEKLAQEVLARSQVERLRDAMLGLEKLPDAAALAALLAA